MVDRRDRKFSVTGNDFPPHSRLFIICPKHLREEDFRKAFESFGKIEELFIVKDKAGENKGVTYIQYSKTSQAALAIEAMNGRNLGSGRGIKVMIAASREQGSKRDTNEEETLQRLFVIVPKTMTDSDLYAYFKQYGDIDYCSIIKDRNTKESKGFAYVKFTKFSYAAKAFEECDRKYKPVFAQPKKPKEERDYSNPNQPVLFDGHVRNGNVNFNLLSPPDNYHDDGYTKLNVIASPLLNQDQIWKLFDIVPTMEFCSVKYEGERGRPGRCLAEVVFSDARWAAYARDKLHGFEFPPGQRLIVRPEYEGGGSSSRDSGIAFGSKRPASAALENVRPDIVQIAETIAQATSLIQAAGLSPDLLQNKLGMLGSNKDGTYCNVKLPSPQPLVSIDAEIKARCFIVCMPSALPNTVLKDIFCRFGNLIDVYMLNNRNCGYAKFASKESAEDAIKTLHGAEVQGMRIKVMEAEEKPESGKRIKIDGDNMSI